MDTGDGDFLVDITHDSCSVQRTEQKNEGSKVEDMLGELQGRSTDLEDTKIEGEFMVFKATSEEQDFQKR